MSSNDRHITRLGMYGRVWAEPHKPKRKRFMAWFEQGWTIEAKYFPTRRSAVLWLIERKVKHIRLMKGLR